MDIAGEIIPDIQINAEHNGGEQQEVGAGDVNISDVLEAIGIADSSYPVNAMSWPHPHVEIVEQPAPKGLRYRYECEGRSAGSIPGVNSTADKKTYPTIKVHGYVGQATIIATCITKDGFLVHPHNLVGRNCRQGVCVVRVNITEEARVYEFKNLGIQCVKRKDIGAALHNRQERKIDPFQMGFDHTRDTSKIDLNAVRLAIQVIVKDAGGREVSMAPVATDVIYDKKSSSDLVITRTSHCSGSARGGTQIIILCEKLVQATKEDTVVAFYETRDVGGAEGEEEVWCVEVAPLLVHKQVALVVAAPPYRQPAARHPVPVRFQLRRRSDAERSNAVDFEYTPADHSRPIHELRRKTPKPNPIYEELGMDQKPVVKLEPRVPSPQMGSPLHQYAPQVFVEQQLQKWESQAGPSNVQAFGQRLPWPQYAAQPSPLMGQPSPMMGQPSPMMGQQSPLMGQPSPLMGQQSPLMGQYSPMMGQPSPLMGQPSPLMGQASPSPLMGQNSPMMSQGSPMSHCGSVSPGPLPSMGHLQHQFVVQQPQADYQAGEGAGAGAGAGAGPEPTISEILAEAELYHLDREALSDSLNRLSTSDLLL